MNEPIAKYIELSLIKFMLLNLIPQAKRRLKDHEPIYLVISGIISIALHLISHNLLIIYFTCRKSTYLYK